MDGFIAIGQFCASWRVLGTDSSGANFAVYMSASRDPRKREKNTWGQNFGTQLISAPNFIGHPAPTLMPQGSWNPGGIIVYTDFSWEGWYQFTTNTGTHSFAVVDPIWHLPPLQPGTNPNAPWGPNAFSLSDGTMFTAFGENEWLCKGVIKKSDAVVFDNEVGGKTDCGVLVGSCGTLFSSLPLEGKVTVAVKAKSVGNFEGKLMLSYGDSERVCLEFTDEMQVLTHTFEEGSGIICLTYKEPIERVKECGSLPYLKYCEWQEELERVGYKAAHPLHREYLHACKDYDYSEYIQCLDVLSERSKEGIEVFEVEVVERDCRVEKLCIDLKA